MEYSFDGAPVFTTVTVQLQQGEKIKAERGAMIAMSSTVNLAVRTSGKGLGGIIKSKISGENILNSEFTAEDGAGEVTFAPPVPGDIKDFKMNGNTIMLQSGSYLAGSAEGLDISIQGSLKSMLMGEGLFLQKISGEGTFFANCYGNIIEKKLGDGEKYKVDNDNFLAFEDSVRYTIAKAGKGFFSSVVSGEGLVIEFTGPGKIWIQSRSLSAFTDLIKSMIPDKS